VVLVVFGVAALTTALSNVRLGQKTADWNDKYYAADAKANEVYAQIDRAAAQWQTQTDPSYDGLDDIADDLNVDIQTEEKDDGVELSYEVWEDDVGINVVLSYSILEDEFTIIKYKAMQEKR
jgi:hypothetical protein